MNELLKASEPTDLELLTKDQLRERIHDGVSLTIEAIKWTAAAVVEWRKRGFDVSELGLTFADQFLLIGFGQVVAEAFYRFGGSPRLWRLVKALPIDLQEKLSTPPYRIPVATPSGERLLDPTEMSHDELTVVFDIKEGRIRSPAEQRSIMEENAPLPPTVEEVSDEIMPGKKGVMVHGVFLTWKQVEMLHRLKNEYAARRERKMAGRS